MAEKQAKTGAVIDTLRYAGVARVQPLHLTITAAGFDRHSICWEQHDYARNVLDGTIDDLAFFAYIAAAPEEANWTEPAVGEMANPSFGVPMSPSIPPHWPVPV